MKSGKVTIVMYHYVRELNQTKYPRIKALLKSEFENQLRYFEKTMRLFQLRIVSML